MRTRNLFAVGILSMFVATASFGSTGLAAHPETERVDIIDHEDLTKDMAERVEQQDSRYAEDTVAKVLTDQDELTRVDVKDLDVEELKGPSYKYMEPMNH